MYWYWQKLYTSIRKRPTCFLGIWFYQYQYMNSPILVYNFINIGIWFSQYWVIISSIQNTNTNTPPAQSNTYILVQTLPFRPHTCPKMYHCQHSDIVYRYWQNYWYTILSIPVYDFRMSPTRICTIYMYALPKRILIYHLVNTGIWFGHYWDTISPIRFCQYLYTISPIPVYDFVITGIQFRQWQVVHFQILTTWGS